MSKTADKIWELVKQQNSAGAENPVPRFDLEDYLYDRAGEIAALIEATEKAVDEAFANGSDYHWIHETRDALRALEETK